MERWGIWVDEKARAPDASGQLSLPVVQSFWRLLEEWGRRPCQCGDGTKAAPERMQGRGKWPLAKRAWRKRGKPFGRPLLFLELSHLQLQSNNMPSFARRQPSTVHCQGLVTTATTQMASCWHFLAIMRWQMVDGAVQGFPKRSHPRQVDEQLPSSVPIPQVGLSSARTSEMRHRPQYNQKGGSRGYSRHGRADNQPHHPKPNRRPTFSGPVVGPGSGCKPKHSLPSLSLFEVLSRSGRGPT